MLEKLPLALAAFAITLSASACNTIEGAGEDVESVADEVTGEP